MSSDLSDYDFGVPKDKATVDRPAYELGDTFSIETGVGVFVELTRDWRLVCNMSIEFLEDEITASPIVSEDYVMKGFAALNYVF